MNLSQKLQETTFQLCLTLFLFNLLDGNKEIVKLRNYTERSDQLIGEARRGDNKVTGLSNFFTYRFINFEWKPSQNSFVPIKFDCTGLLYDELRTIYTRTERVTNDALRELQLMKFGKCEVEVPKKSPFKVLVSEVLNPFYIF